MHVNRLGWLSKAFTLALVGLTACDEGESTGGAGGASSTTGSGTSTSSGTTGSGGSGGMAPPEPGTHFEGAVDWVLPAGSPSGNGFFSTGNGQWATVDLDGDGLPDLVVTTNATEQNRKWKLYKNTGTGFATKAVDWVLPGGSPSGNGFFSTGNGQWATVDLDGDGLLDLVVTTNATEQNRKWKLYKNTGTGFATKAVDWALPGGSPSGNGFFSTGNGQWSTIDITGNGKLDLVVTTNATEQNRKWRRYVNTGTGFAAKAVDWALPAGSPSGNGFFSTGNGQWSTLDITGNGKPDLVLTTNATEQSRKWKRYANTGSGFEAKATDWALPGGSPNGNGFFSTDNGQWATIDLTGYGKPDLVVTTTATEKNRKWRRYPNSGSGFAAKSVDWALPAGSPSGNGYFSVGNGQWTTFDIDGDGRPDLVLTTNATEKNRKWKVYRNVP